MQTLRRSGSRELTRVPGENRVRQYGLVHIHSAKGLSDETHLEAGFEAAGKWCALTSIFASVKGYKSSHNKRWIKHVILEGEQSKAHIGEDEVLSQEIEKLEQLK